MGGGAGGGGRGVGGLVLLCDGMGCELLPFVIGLKGRGIGMVMGDGVFDDMGWDGMGYDWPGTGFFWININEGIWEMGTMLAFTSAILGTISPLFMVACSRGGGFFGDGWTEAFSG